MQEPGKEADFEKARSSMRGLIDRIMAIEHPDAKPAEADLSRLKAELARYSSELEHISYRYEARTQELKHLKMQYEELEHKFMMRPETMRRTGEMEVTEIVKKRHELAELEKNLEKSRLELAGEKEGLAAGAKAALAARLAELERAHADKDAALRAREERISAREAAASGSEKHVREAVQEARRQAVEEASSSFEREAAAQTGTFSREKAVLSGELSKWRLKAEETQAQLGEARKESEAFERRAELAEEAAAAARQKSKISEMELAAAAKRLEEWEKKGLESEKQRVEMHSAAEAGLKEERTRCETFKAEVRELNNRLRALETENLSLQASLREKEKAAEQARGRVETEVPALAAELKEEKVRAEALRAELRGARERLEVSEKQNYALSASALENEKAAGQARARCDSEIPGLQADLRSAKEREEALRNELKGVREHRDKVLKESGALEEELELTRERHLKAEAQKDAERTGKMEALLTGMAGKERDLEESWTRRHKNLETEQKTVQAEFERRHAAIMEDLHSSVSGMEKLFAQKEARLIELNKRMTEEFQDREARVRTAEEELRAQASAINASAAELSGDYELKVSELEALKRKVVSEMQGAGGNK